VEGPDLRPQVGPVDLAGISAGASGPGTVWTEREGRDLNANLVRFPEGEGVGEHVNGEVDVLFVGVSGSGTVEIDGRRHALGPGVLILAPRGARRATRSASDDFSYLTVHTRRGPVRLGAGRERPDA
jgi:quercetin dioxygenase-like cupin family protein